MSDKYVNLLAQIELDIAVQVTGVVHRFIIDAEDGISRSNTSPGSWGIWSYLFGYYLPRYQVMGNHKGD